MVTFGGILMTPRSRPVGAHLPAGSLPAAGVKSERRPRGPGAGIKAGPRRRGSGKRNGFRFHPAPWRGRFEEAMPRKTCYWRPFQKPQKEQDPSRGEPVVAPGETGSRGGRARTGARLTEARRAGVPTAVPSVRSATRGALGSRALKCTCASKCFLSLSRNAAKELCRIHDTEKLTRTRRALPTVSDISSRSRLVAELVGDSALKLIV